MYISICQRAVAVSFFRATMAKAKAKPHRRGVHGSEALFATLHVGGPSYSSECPGEARPRKRRARRGAAASRTSAHGPVGVSEGSGAFDVDEKNAGRVRTKRGPVLFESILLDSGQRSPTIVHGEKMWGPGYCESGTNDVMQRVTKSAAWDWDPDER